MSPARQWAVKALQNVADDAATPGEKLVYEGWIEEVRQRELIVVIRDFHCENYFSITKHGARSPAQETVHAILSAALTAEARTVQ